MSKILSVILTAILFLTTSVYAEKEYQFDIIFEPDYGVRTYSFDGKNIIAEDTDKIHVYNQKMEKIDEYDKASASGVQQDNDTEENEMPQGQPLETYGYGCMSEFVNGFSFVREQEVNGLPLGYDTGYPYYLFSDHYSNDAREKAYQIAEEIRYGYKFIDEAGNVVFDNLEARVDVRGYLPSKTEPGGWCSVTFVPSYFNQENMAVVKRDGKHGIIDTSGTLLCDFLYDKIYLCNKDIAIVKSGGRDKFYYINSREESEFSATAISPLKDNFYYAYEADGTKGVIDCYGNIILPDRSPHVLKGNNAITYMDYNSPVTYYDEDFEVVCYFSSRMNGDGTYDKDSNVIWEDFKVISSLTNNIYIIQRDGPGNYIRALAAINQIPKPSYSIGDKYISIMFNNPLVNVGGCTRTIEEKNYFYTPVVRDDRILLPYELLSALDIWTRWDEETQTLYAGRGTNTVVLKVGDNELYLNDNAIDLDVPAESIDDRILIPYEAVAVALGADWDWDGANETLSLFFE